MHATFLPDKGRAALRFGWYELRKVAHWAAPVLSTAAVCYVVAHGDEWSAAGGLRAIVAALVTLGIRFGYLTVSDNSKEKLP